MKLTVKWYPMNFTEYDRWCKWKQQSFPNRNAIFWLFSVPLITRWHITWSVLYAKGTGMVTGKQKISVSHRAVCRQRKAQRIIRLLILTRFTCSEEGNTVFTDPNNRQVKINWFLMVLRNQHVSFKYIKFNLRLREIIFVTDVAVLTSETTKLVFKPLDIFWRFWNTRKR